MCQHASKAREIARGPAKPVFSPAEADFLVRNRLVCSRGDVSMRRRVKVMLDPQQPIPNNQQPTTDGTRDEDDSVSMLQVVARVSEACAAKLH